MKKTLFFLLSLTLIVSLTACTKKNPDEQNFDKFYQGSPDAPETTQTPTESVNPETSKASDETLTTNTTQDMTFSQTALPQKGDKIAVITTNKGVIKIRLFPQFAPKTVENFIGLAEKGYYNGLIFHRVIPDFMIQGGDPTGTGMGGESIWGGTFADEFSDSVHNIHGALSMANAGPGTNGSQFFIVQAPATPWLDGHHTVFGQTFEGLDIVDTITNVERDAMDKPLEDIIMKNVMIETQQ